MSSCGIEGGSASMVSARDRHYDTRPTSWRLLSWRALRPLCEKMTGTLRRAQREEFTTEAANNSEVVRIRQQVDAEWEAAQRGLFGLASGVSRHDFIIKRMEHGAERIFRLVEEGKYEEARALAESDTWCNL